MSTIYLSKKKKKNSRDNIRQLFFRAGGKRYTGYRVQFHHNSILLCNFPSSYCVQSMGKHKIYAARQIKRRSGIPFKSTAKCLITEPQNIR